MSKLDLVLTLAVPNMQMAASLLRRKDANSTGSDDLTADILDFAAGAVQAVQNGLPMPDLPKSLRPKESAEATE